MWPIATVNTMVDGRSMALATRWIRRVLLRPPEEATEGVIAIPVLWLASSGGAAVGGLQLAFGWRPSAMAISMSTACVLLSFGLHVNRLPLLYS